MNDMIVYKSKKSHAALKTGAKFIFAVIVMCLVCALIFVIGSFMSGKSLTASSVADNSKPLPVIVIDAGHGGRDGGAVAPDGTVEKDINLAVAKRLEALCRLSGLDYVMTRSEDVALTPEGVTSHKKMHDLKGRLAIVNDLEASGKSTVLISIHMNNFSSSKYSGLQVWYSKNHEESRKLAALMQAYAKSFLDAGNNREIKGANSSIYLLERAESPAILIECGFLSNPEELTKLMNEEYQTELALTIFAAVSHWFYGK